MRKGKKNADQLADCHAARVDVVQVVVVGRQACEVGEDHAREEEEDGEGVQAGVEDVQARVDVVQVAEEDGDQAAEEEGDQAAAEDEVKAGAAEELQAEDLVQAAAVDDGEGVHVVVAAAAEEEDQADDDEDAGETSLPDQEAEDEEGETVYG